MAKSKFLKLVKLSQLGEAVDTGTDQMEKMVVRLQRAVDEINDVAFFFESLGMLSQSDRLDSALDHVENVQEVIEVLLGRVELAGFARPATSKKKRPTKSLRAKGVKVAA